MRFIIGKKYVAAAFAVAAVATQGASRSFNCIGERVGNARPNHYDPITYKQVTGWTVAETAPQNAHTQSSRNLRPSQ